MVALTVRLVVRMLLWSIVTGAVVGVVFFGIGMVFGEGDSRSRRFEATIAGEIAAVFGLFLGPILFVVSRKAKRAE